MHGVLKICPIGMTAKETEGIKADGYLSHM